MRIFAAVLLVFASAFMFAPPAFAQEDSTLWEVENPQHYIDLIDKHTPPITEGTSDNGHFCSPLLGNASNSVSEAAASGQLYWTRPPRVKSDVRGATLHGVGYIQILINKDYWEHTDDYQVSRTMAHEGLHGYFGPAPFMYRGKVYTAERNEEGVRKHEQLIRDIIEDCYEEEKPEEEDPVCGAASDCGGDPEPVCEEKEVAEYYTVYEPKWQEVEVCVGFNAWGSDEIANWCNTEWREVMVPVEKVRWVTQTVCESGDGP